MIKSIYILAFSLVALFSTTPITASALQSTKKKPKVDTVKVLTQYEKLFDKKKNIKSVQGLMKLHKVEEKILAEVPESLFGKPMLIYSFAEQVSDPNLAFLGRRVGREMKVVFTHTDSLIIIRHFVPLAISSNSNVIAALEKSNLGPVIFTFPIEAHSPDSTAIVFNAAKLFLSDEDNVVAINSASGPMGMSQTKANYVSGNSFLNDIIAYDDHIEILTTKSYKVDATDIAYSGKDNPLTVVARTIVSPMPTEIITPRIADSRIGVATVSVTDFSAFDGSKDLNYAMRWRLEPADKEAYGRGELVEPVKPIVFYVDTLFKQVWQDAIIYGIERWNDAFEAIGFKNVIKALPYPANDSTFNATNYSYNCVKYNQTSGRDISTRRTVDYRSGEILSASIGIGRDVEYMSMQPEALIIQGAYNPNVRGITLPDKELYEAVVTSIMRATGVCLGFEPNYAAAAAYSVEQLRDPAFTTENGFANSVMTPLNYNYLLQPEDYKLGAKPTTNKLGPYDYLAVKWLYQPIEGTPKEAFEITSSWISQHIGDANYKYSPIQPFSMLFDPRYAAGALSTDVITAQKLVRKNQQYIVDNAAEWIDLPQTEEVYKMLFPDFVFLKIFNTTPLLGYLGGYVITDPIDALSNPTAHSTSQPTYRAIPMSKQKEVLKYLLDFSADMSWADNDHLLACSGINDNMSDFLSFNIINNIFGRLGSLPVLMDAPLNSTESTYRELMSYAASIILPKVSSGKTLLYGEQIQLLRFTAMLRESILLKPQYDSNGNVVTVTEAPQPTTEALYTAEGLYKHEGLLYNPLEGLKYYSRPALTGFNYNMLEKVLQSAETGARLSSHQQQKDALNHLCYTIRKQLNGE